MRRLFKIVCAGEIALYVVAEDYANAVDKTCKWLNAEREHKLKRDLKPTVRNPRPEEEIESVTRIGEVIL